MRIIHHTMTENNFQNSSNSFLYLYLCFLCFYFWLPQEFSPLCLIFSGHTLCPPLGSLLCFTEQIPCEGKQHTMALLTYTNRAGTLWTSELPPNNGPHTTPVKIRTFLFRYALQPLVRASKWGGWNNVPEQLMERLCFVQSWESSTLLPN